MNYLFHPEAEIELNAAIEYYEGCELGLGYDFALEVYSGIKLIIKYPEAWQVINLNIRRSLINRFPFGILYTIEKNSIIILAIMHLHKEPNYWINRM